MKNKVKTIAEALKNKGALTGPEARNIENFNEKDFLNTLIDKKYLPDDQLYQVISDITGLEHVKLESLDIPQDLFEMIPPELCYKLKICPVRLHAGTLLVATSYPIPLLLINQLHKTTTTPVRFSIAPEKSIQSSLDASYANKKILKSLSSEFKVELIKEGKDGSAKCINLEDIDDSSAPVVKLINTTIKNALEQRASDIHIETQETGVNIRYRIDGVLAHATELLDFSHHASLVSRLKVMADLDIAEKRIPQDGRFKLRLRNKETDFRLSIIPSINGEDAVIRILDKTNITKSTEKLSLNMLDLQRETLAKIRDSFQRPHGIILISGPTGSGKSTTLYAALNEINTTKEKIITIEDPVEYLLDGVVQIAVNPKKKLTFATGLRSILRHDPDKIMVGEIRDQETAEVAIQLALTGHLVMSTVHANSALEIISRFKHMGIDMYSLISSLNSIMAQRLVRILCPHCKATDETSSNAVLEKLTLNHRDHTIFQHTGCQKCNHTGYKGRTPVIEFINIDDDIRELLLQERPTREIQQLAMQKGMIGLFESARGKILSGTTSIKEVLRVIDINQ